MTTPPSGLLMAPCGTKLSRTRFVVGFGWKLKGPLGTKVEFDAEMTQDEPGRSIGWNSRDGQMGSTGNVTFTPMEDNTLVHVVMQWYDPPAGPIGEAVSRILQDPQKMLDED